MSISSSTIEVNVRKPLETEKARFNSLLKDLTSIKAELKSLLSALGISEKAIEDSSAWLESVAARGDIQTGSTLSDALHASNKLQAELSTRELGLESSLSAAKENLRKIEESGGSPEAFEKAREKIIQVQQLVDK